MQLARGYTLGYFCCLPMHQPRPLNSHLCYNPDPLCGYRYIVGTGISWVWVWVMLQMPMGGLCSCLLPHSVLQIFSTHHLMCDGRAILWGLNRWVLCRLGRENLCTPMENLHPTMENLHTPMEILHPTLEILCTHMENLHLTMENLHTTMDNP